MVPGHANLRSVERGEGVAQHTFFSYALLKRLSGADQDVSYQPVNLRQAMSDPLSPADLRLKAGDELDIYDEAQMEDQPTVRVEGEVRMPGLYALSRGMRVSDLIYAAGGTREDAYLARAELARTQVIDGSRTLHKYSSIDLRAALHDDPTQNLILHPNDELSVRVAPGWHLPYVVTIKGQVLRPGPYIIHPGERLDDLLKRCGGLLPDAFLQGMVFIRASIRKAEQHRFNEARARLSRNLAELQLTAVQSSTNTAGLPKEIKGLQHLLSEAQGVQVSGRLVISTASGTDQIPPSQNVVLQDKDEIVIPRQPVAVNVLGQVYNPTAIVYDPSLTVQAYLQRAGGPTELADTKNILVIKADGSILTEKGYTESRKSRIFPLLPLISGGLMESRLGPGDTIYVPEKILRVDKVKMAKDVATIIGQSASALGIVGVLAASL